MSDPSGHFVTLEGGDGSGKSTQLDAIARRARSAGREVITCREPGGTALGERLRDALFLRDDPPSPEAELLTFAAARAQLVHEVIRPALTQGTLVICDRFADSTIAYQHYGRGIPAEVVWAVNATATGGLQPDLTVLLDMTAGAGLTRGTGADYMHREQLEFHERVRAGYLELARREPERWLVLDGTSPAPELTEDIWARIQRIQRLR